MLPLLQRRRPRRGAERRAREGRRGRDAGARRRRLQRARQVDAAVGLIGAPVVAPRPRRQRRVSPGCATAATRSTSTTRRSTWPARRATSRRPPARFVLAGGAVAARADDGAPRPREPRRDRVPRGERDARAEEEGRRSRSRPRRPTRTRRRAAPATAPGRSARPRSSPGASWRRSPHGTGYIEPDDLAEFAPSVPKFDEALEDEVVRNGWFREKPSKAIVALGDPGDDRPLPRRSPRSSRASTSRATGLSLIGGAALVGGIAVVVLARWMPAVSIPGSMIRAMLAAYRRTLEKTMAQARVDGRGRREAGLTWLETPDQAVVWGTALGLEKEIEGVLERSIDDVSKGVAPASSTYFPVWFAGSGGRGAGGSSAFGAGGGGLLLELRRARHRRDDGVALDDRHAAGRLGRRRWRVRRRRLGRRRRRLGRRVLRRAQPSAVDRLERRHEAVDVVAVVVERDRDADDAPRRVGRLGGRDRPRPRSGPRSANRSVDRRLERVGVERRRVRGAAPPSGPSPGAAAPPSSRASTPAASTSPVDARDRPRRRSIAQLVVPGHDRRPAALDHPADRLERRGHGEPRRRVERPLPVELARGTAAFRVVRARSPRGRSSPAGSPAWRSRRTWRKAAPFGAQTHLWRLPRSTAAPSASRSSGTIPGACAPSTSVSIPRSASAADDPLDREHERGRARDVADDREPGPIGGRRRGSARRRRPPRRPGTAAERRRRARRRARRRGGGR